jgi:hypothetical protein
VQDAASHGSVIRVYDDEGNLIETHEHKGRFQRTLNVAGVTQRAAMPQSVTAHYGTKAASVG